MSLISLAYQLGYRDGFQARPARTDPDLSYGGRMYQEYQDGYAKGQDFAFWEAVLSKTAYLWRPKDAPV